MKRSQAPLFTRGMDVCVWMFRQFQQDTITAPGVSRLNDCLLDFYEEVGVALEFRHGRVARLHSMDMLLRRAKSLCLLLRETGVLSLRQCDFLWGELEDMGRMVGGWIKKELAYSKSQEMEPCM
ncbi:hypothetical protein JW905_06420 [bacterium]|nr:hypothetical protein [candidate division CSSED10-310 bacterium]